MQEQSATEVPLVEIIKRVLENQLAIVKILGNEQLTAAGSPTTRLLWAATAEANTSKLLNTMEGLKKTNTPLEAVKLIVDRVQGDLARYASSPTFEQATKALAFDEIVALFP